MGKLKSDLNWHARDMETMGKEGTLAQHPLVSRAKLNLRDRKGMAEMQ